MTVAYLHVVEGPGAGAIHSIEDGVTIGRGHAADVVLDDRTVSREHARAHVEGVTVVVEDLGSSNGTLVNGELIESAVRVGDGDLIQVGAAELQVRIETGEGEQQVRTPTEPTVVDRERHPQT